MHYGASSRKSKTKMSRILRRVSRNKEVFYPNIVNLSLHDRFVMNLMLVDANTIKILVFMFAPCQNGRHIVKVVHWVSKVQR